MILASFLGTGSYQEVEYVREPASPARTRFAALALAQFLRPSRVLLLVTETAAQHANCSALEAALAQAGVPSQRIALPERASQAELWGSFATVETWAGTEPLALDITHGFRSSPMVAMLAASYFQALGKIELAGLYYGAFEARDEQGRAPIFDLTPMLLLPQWALAARAWRDHANAAPLRALVRAAAARGWQQGSNGPRALNHLGSCLDAFASGLALARHDLSTQAAALQAALAAAGPEVARFAPPLVPLLAEATEPLRDLMEPGVAAQLALARQQLSAGHLLAATLLAREWLVSYWLQRQNLADRKAAEDDLGVRAQLRDATQPSAVWSRLAEMRNDLAHCGHRSRPLSAADVEGQLQSVLAVLAALP